MVQVLEREIFPLVKGFKDTPFIVYMLKTQLWQNEKYIERVYFEQEVGLNRHWLQARCHALRASLPSACPIERIRCGGTRVRVCMLAKHSLHHEQVNWGNEEMPLLVHYAGCTVCHPPEGKLSEEVRCASAAWPFQWAAVQDLALRYMLQQVGVKTDI